MAELRQRLLSGLRNDCGSSVPQVPPGNEERGRYRIDPETAASALTVLLNALRDLAPSPMPPASSA